MSKLLTVPEVADLTRLSQATIYAYVAGKKIPFLKLGARTMFEEQEIIKWIQARRIQPLES